MYNGIYIIYFSTSHEDKKLNKEQSNNIYTNIKKKLVKFQLKFLK